ncbi:MAG TPA: hypothetical protein VH415_07910 [Nitrososphaeraceae archaeon]
MIRRDHLPGSQADIGKVVENFRLPRHPGQIKAVLALSSYAPTLSTPRASVNRHDGEV